MKDPKHKANDSVQRSVRDLSSQSSESTFGGKTLNILAIKHSNCWKPYEESHVNTF